MIDKIETNQIHIPAPHDTEGGREMLARINEIIRRPKTPPSSIRSIANPIPECGLTYDPIDTHTYIVRFNNPISPALCRQVRDILHSRLGMDKDAFNALNPLALSAQSAPTKRNTPDR